MENILSIQSRGPQNGASTFPQQPEQPELLVFECSPSVSAEAAETASQKWQHPPAITQHGGDISTLRDLFRHKLKQFLFIGHASETQEMKLGFTRPVGGLVDVNPQELSLALGQHVAIAGGALELVFLNGSRSESLARQLLLASVPAVVCWTTRLHNGAATTFAEAFIEHMESADSDYTQVRRTSSTCYPPLCTSEVSERSRPTRAGI